jgi:glycosyltransferase involved in cell wall biosynthesis
MSSSDLIQHENLKVSIITPSFNQGKFIEKTILSVLCQDYLNLQYIVVDGLSNDETTEILQKYQKYIDILIIEKDDGQSDALNKGFELATGDVITYLNSDDCYSDQNVLSRVVNYFNTNTDADVVYGLRNVIDENGFFVYCFPYKPFCKEALYLSDYIPQECVFWRKQIFERAGSYVSREFDFAMDYELWLRFLDFNAIFISVNDVFGLFRFYALQKSISLWQTKGLPEIAKLHQKYLNKTISEEEMQGHFKEYLYGINPPPVQPELGSRYEQMWVDYTTLKRQLLCRSPLDAWVYRYKQNLYQRFKN